MECDNYAYSYWFLFFDIIVKARFIMKGILFFIFLIYLNSSFSRSPAVEPVSGLSIDHVTKPDKVDVQTSGYNWSKVDASLPVAKVDKDLLDSDKNEEISFYVLGTTLALIPMLLFWLFRRKVKEDAYQNNLDNVVQLPQKDEDSDHHDIPKAS